MTHYLPFFTKSHGGRQRAACGTYIEPAAHSATPRCEQCLDYLTSEQLALGVAEAHDARKERAHVSES